MVQLHFDVVIIGMGIGAAAIAHRIAGTSTRVAMTPGVGCARFKHLDGGLMSAKTLETAFGTSRSAPLHVRGAYSTFRRDQLEAWAIDQVRERVTVVGAFDDLRIVPHESGGHAVHEESGERELVGRLVILTEGASPKIGIAARLRPDFEPEDLLHFGRVILPGVRTDEPVSGAWRTSWGMPAWYSVVPHADGVIVGASARIENIMRAGRDGRDVVKDLLRSPLGGQLELPETVDAVGMELVPLGLQGQKGHVAAQDILITPDANGSIDPRLPQRYEEILRTAIHIGDTITREWPNMPDWDNYQEIWNVPSAARTPYHDSSETGFIEDGAGKPRRLLHKLLKR